MIQAWDKMFPDHDPVPRIRLLRRLPNTSAAFASVVGCVLTNGLHFKPTVRVSRMVMQKATLDTGLHLQMLAAALMRGRAELEAITVKYCLYLRNKQLPPAQQLPPPVLSPPSSILHLFADYNNVLLED